MDIPVRVSINRKSLDGKTLMVHIGTEKSLIAQQAGYLSPRQGHHKGPRPSSAPPPPLREPILLIHFHSGLVFSLYRLLLHNLQSLVYF